MRQRGRGSGPPTPAPSPAGGGSRPPPPPSPPRRPPGAAPARRPPGPAPGPILAGVGGPGVGNTARAVPWSHPIGDRFAGGPLHVDLHGYDAAPPAEPAAVLDSLLRALGTPPERIPADLDA